MSEKVRKFKVPYKRGAFPVAKSPGGRLGLNHAPMCVFKSEGNGFFFSFK